MDDFIEKDVQIFLKNIKNGKAAGADGILPEFIKKKNWALRADLELHSSSQI